jgi:tetratricopeptide (TPR) repeat protein
MAVVKLDPKGKRSQFCASSAVFAAGEMVKAEAKEGKIEKASKDNKTEAVPLSDWENKKLAALDQYSQLFPDDKDTKGMIYEAGYLYYNKNQFKEASDRFRVVIGMDPQSKQAMLAANLILDSFNLVEDWKNLKDVSKAFYDQESLGNKKFKEETYTIYQNASLKLIEVTLEQDSNKTVAAESLVAWYEEFPKAENADLALNNAATYFYTEGARKQAMETRLLLLENFPKSKFYNSQVALLGYDYESMADFKSAAEQYEKLFTLDKENENSPDALYSAALFRRALGEWEVAVENYQKYITAYPDRENVQQVQLEIGMLYEENAQHEQAAKVYQQFFTAKDPKGVSADELMYARLHYGLAMEEMGQTSKAEKHYEESIKWFQAAKEAGTEMALGVEFGAQMMFILAQDDFDEYMAMKISGPSGRVSQRQEDKILGDNLLKKVRTLKEIETLYAGIVGTGAGEWGLAALVNLGMAYENFADSMVNSYVPSYLTEDQAEFYKMDLEASAYSQEEKAVEAYSVALDKSYELNLYNDKLAFATRRLGELRPEQFPGLEETLMEPNFTSAAGQATQSFVDNL